MGDRGTIRGSSLGFRMSAEPPESVAPSANIDLHGYTIFATQLQCTG
jgi:hypothetical protein